MASSIVTRREEKSIKEISEPKGYVVLITMVQKALCPDCISRNDYNYYYHTKNTNLNELKNKLEDYMSNLEDFYSKQRGLWLSHSEYNIYKIVYIEKNIVIDELIDDGLADCSVDFYKKNMKYYFNEKSSSEEEEDDDDEDDEDEDEDEPVKTAVECKASHYLGFETKPILDELCSEWDSDYEDKSPWNDMGYKYGYDTVTFKGFAIQDDEDELYSYHEFINLECDKLCPNIIGLESVVDNQDDGKKYTPITIPYFFAWDKLTSYTWKYVSDDFDYANDILKFPNSLIELKQRKKEKAISTLNDKFLPYLQHYLYNPNGPMAKKISDTTLVGKKHREEKDISTLTNKVFFDIIYFIYEMLLE